MARQKLLLNLETPAGCFCCVFETPGYAGGATQVYRWEIKAPCVKLKLPTTYFRLVILAANCRIANHRAATFWVNVSFSHKNSLFSLVQIGHYRVNIPNPLGGVLYPIQASHNEVLVRGINGLFKYCRIGNYAFMRERNQTVNSAVFQQKYITLYSTLSI